MGEDMGTSVKGENPAALPGKVLAHQIRTVAGKSIVNGVNTLIMKGIALPGELRQQQNRGGGSEKEFDRYGKVTERFCNVLKTTNVGKHQRYAPSPKRNE